MNRYGMHIGDTGGRAARHPGRAGATYTGVGRPDPWRRIAVPKPPRAGTPTATSCRWPRASIGAGNSICSILRVPSKRPTVAIRADPLPARARRGQRARTRPREIEDTRRRRRDASAALRRGAGVPVHRRRLDRRARRAILERLADEDGRVRVLRQPGSPYRRSRSTSGSRRPRRVRRADGRAHAVPGDYLRAASSGCGPATPSGSSGRLSRSAAAAGRAASRSRCGAWLGVGSARVPQADRDEVTGRHRVHRRVAARTLSRRRLGRGRRSQPGRRARGAGPAPAGGRIVCAAGAWPRDTSRATASRASRASTGATGTYRAKTSRRHPDSLRRSHVLPGHGRGGGSGGDRGDALRRPARLGHAALPGAVAGGEREERRAARPGTPRALPAVFATMHAAWASGLPRGLRRVQAAAARLSWRSSAENGRPAATRDRKQPRRSRVRLAASTRPTTCTGATASALVPDLGASRSSRPGSRRRSSASSLFATTSIRHRGARHYTAAGRDRGAARCPSGTTRALSRPTDAARDDPCASPRRFWRESRRRSRRSGWSGPTRSRSCWPASPSAPRAGRPRRPARPSAVCRAIDSAACTRRWGIPAGGRSRGRVPDRRARQPPR